MNPWLARELTYRVFDQADSGNRRFQRLCDPVVMRTILENRGRLRIRQKSFQTAVNTLRREASRNPAVAQTSFNPGGANRPRSVIVSLFVPMLSTSRTAGGDDPIAYNAIGVNHVELAAEEKCLQVRHWFSPVQFTAHAVTRFFERCVETSSDQAMRALRQAMFDTVPTASLWSAMLSRQHDPWDDTLPNQVAQPDVVLPHESGAFCGTFAVSGAQAALESGFLELRPRDRNRAFQHRMGTVVDIRTALDQDRMSDHQASVTRLIDELIQETTVNNDAAASRDLIRDTLGWPAALDGGSAPFSQRSVFLTALKTVLDRTNASSAFRHWSMAERGSTGAGLRFPGIQCVAARSLDRDLFRDATASVVNHPPKPVASATAYEKDQQSGVLEMQKGLS